MLAKRGFGNGFIHFVPAKIGSLSELNGKKLLVDFSFNSGGNICIASVSWQLFDPLTVFSADITGLRCFLNCELMSLFTVLGKRIFIKFCGLICFISASKPSDNKNGENFSCLQCGLNTCKLPHLYAFS